MKQVLYKEQCCVYMIYMAAAWATHEYGCIKPINSLIADSALQLAFAAATGNFRSISALKSIHI